MKRNKRTSVLFHEAPPNSNYTAGSWSWVSDSTAERYIEEGSGEEWKPELGMSNTKAEIIENLEENGIEYDESLTKKELLNLGR